MRRTEWWRAWSCLTPSATTSGSQTPPSFSSWTRRTCLRRRSRNLPSPSASQSTQVLLSDWRIGSCKCMEICRHECLSGLVRFHNSEGPDASFSWQSFIQIFLGNGEMKRGWRNWGEEGAEGDVKLWCLINNEANMLWLDPSLAFANQVLSCFQVWFAQTESPF